MHDSSSSRRWHSGGMSLICCLLNNGVFQVDLQSDFYVSPNGRCLNKQLDLTWCWCEECTELVAMLVRTSWFPYLQLDHTFEIVSYSLKWWQTFFILHCSYPCFYICLLITCSRMMYRHLHFWIMFPILDICCYAYNFSFSILT